ncbi:MAG: hypothetical protein CVV27_12600, partial [Candidatus Melainabacteria bacterium HGW-Melainabacteria-1]
MRQAVVSQLSVELQDRDGLANFGQHDIKAKVSGEILVDSGFLLAKLGELKSDQEKKFHKPEFDAERRQYVINGTAVNKILGLFDIGFEIRLGAVDGKLAFRVDSGLKRGSIYEDLSKMLKEQGLATYEKDGQLFIKPEYHQTISLPALGDQPARIEKVGANADNLRFEIAANGQIKLKLKQLPVDMSSETGTRNPIKASPDTAWLKLDLGFDRQLNPTVKLIDGRVQATAGSREMEKFLPEDGRALLAEQLGTALTVSLTGLRGQIRPGQAGGQTSGLALNTSGQVTISNSDGTARVSAALQTALSDGKAVINASQANIRLTDGSQATVAGIRYDGRRPGLNLQINDLDGQLNQQGVQVKLNDITGSVSRSEAGLLKASLRGQSAGTIDRDGIQADFSTSGAHQLTINGDRIQAEVDQAEIRGKYQAPEASEPEAGAKADKADPKHISIKVGQISATGKVMTSAATIDAQASQGSLQLELGRTTSVKSTARMQISAQGENLQANASLPKGAEVKMDAQGMRVTAQDADIQGKFDKPGKLMVDGLVRGDLQVGVDPNGKVKVDGGSFDARFALKDKVKVSGKGEQVSFAIDAKENIELTLGQTQATTELTAGKTRLKTTTRGEQARVSVINDDVSIETHKAKSQLQ